jgi:hypothetical protein
MTKPVRIADDELIKLAEAYEVRTGRYGNAALSDVLNALAGTPGYQNVLSDLR